MSRIAATGEAGARIDPTPVLQLTTAYWASMVLLAANHLGVFPLLAEGARTAEEVAAGLDLDARAAGMLLDACVGQELLSKRDGRYALAPVAEAFLVPGRPGFLGGGLHYALDLYETWGRLPEGVATGRPTLAATSILGDDAEKTRHFVFAMHHRALGVARSLAGLLDLRGRTRLLDIGGGPGTYSALLTQATPGLRAVVLDLPEVVAIADEILAELGSSERVVTVAGDYHTTELPPGNDVVLMSGMLHRETPAACRRLFERAHASLEEGGLLVVSDVFFDDEEKTRPPFASLFALNMMLTSETGCAHSRPEMARWMRRAGFTDLEERHLPPPMPHSLLLGRRANRG